MTETQLTEIRNYLLSKKLPIDILIEVNDHFISQISDLQKEKNLGFEKAFEEVKENWKDELNLSWGGGFNLEDTTPFLRNVNRQLANSTFMASLKYCLTIILTIIVVCAFCSEIFFKYYTLMLFLFLSIFPLFTYIKNFKNFRLAKKYNNYILTLHQGGSFLFLSILALALQFEIKFFEHSEEIQKLFQLKKTVLGFWKILLVITGTLTIIIISLYSIISQKKYLQQMQKVKPFLKYL